MAAYSGRTINYKCLDFEIKCVSYHVKGLNSLVEIQEARQLKANKEIKNDVSSF